MHRKNAKSQRRVWNLFDFTGSGKNFVLRCLVFFPAFSGIICRMYIVSVRNIAKNRFFSVPLSNLFLLNMVSRVILVRFQILWFFFSISVGVLVLELAHFYCNSGYPNRAATKPNYFQESVPATAVRTSRDRSRLLRAEYPS